MPDGYDYNPIAGEPWNTDDGGNTDFRAPYVGYSPNAAFFETVGNSAYDALETHLEKRLVASPPGRESATPSATPRRAERHRPVLYRQQSEQPANVLCAGGLRSHPGVFGELRRAAPNAAKPNTLLSYFTNDWNLSGMAVLQSGEPYSLYEFYGAVGSIFFGDYPTLMNPVLPIKNAGNPKWALTGHSGAYRAGSSFIPAIDPSQIAIHYLAPGRMAFRFRPAPIRRIFTRPTLRRGSGTSSARRSRSARICRSASSFTRRRS